MEFLVGIRLGIFHHHFLLFLFRFPERIPFFGNPCHDTLQIFFRKKKIDISRRDRFDFPEYVFY